LVDFSEEQEYRMHAIIIEGINNCFFIVLNLHGRDKNHSKTIA
jgi:hypothetical protein